LVRDLALPVLREQAQLQIPVQAQAPEEEVLRALVVRQISAVEVVQLLPAYVLEQLNAHSLARHVPSGDGLPPGVLGLVEQECPRHLIPPPTGLLVPVFVEENHRRCRSGWWDHSPFGN